MYRILDNCYSCSFSFYTCQSRMPVDTKDCFFASCGEALVRGGFYCSTLQLKVSFFGLCISRVDLTSFPKKPKISVKEFLKTVEELSRVG